MIYNQYNTVYYTFIKDCEKACVRTYNGNPLMVLEYVSKHNNTVIRYVVINFNVTVSSNITDSYIQ